MHELLHMTYLARVDRELDEITRQRPRLDRPDPRRQGRFRRLLQLLALPPARVGSQPGEAVPEVTIRPARAGDMFELTRLAQTNERAVPSGPVLVAEVGSELVAAVPLDGGPLLSDLWRRTEDVAQLLELRAEQVRRIEIQPRAA